FILGRTIFLAFFPLLQMILPFPIQYNTNLKKNATNQASVETRFIVSSPNHVLQSLIEREFDKFGRTPLQTSPRRGERLKTLIIWYSVIDFQPLPL
ncbi:hypothetical protein, partial [Trichormus variabilis]|uniref:hypothetical protein n=1 Tax=Anabaena variabilis TaxID=264691 RepID=UPI001A919D64